MFYSNLQIYLLKICYYISLSILYACYKFRKQGCNLEILLAPYEPDNNCKEELLKPSIFAFSIRAHTAPDPFLTSNAPSSDFGACATPWSEVAIQNSHACFCKFRYCSVFKTNDKQIYGQHLSLPHICAADPKTEIKRGSLEQLREYGLQGKDAYETFIKEVENEWIISFFCCGDKWYRLPDKLAKLGRLIS